MPGGRNHASRLSPPALLLPQGRARSSRVFAILLLLASGCEVFKTPQAPGLRGAPLVFDVWQGDNLQAKFDAAPEGSTVRFNGAVTTGASVVLRKSVTVTGSQGHKLKSSPGQYAFSVEANNITFTGLDFEGNLIKMFKAGHPDGLVVTKNKLAGKIGAPGPMGQNDGGIIAWGIGNRQHDAAPTNCKITNNIFDPIESWTAIFGCGWQNVEIAYNEFRHRKTPSNPNSMGRCIKLFGQGADDPSLPYGADNRARLWPKRMWIHHNYFGKVRGFAIEKQDGGVDDVIEDNYYEETDPSGTFPADYDNWAFSIVSGSSVDEIVRRNYLDCRLPSGITNKSSFRVAGEGGGCRQQYIDNFIIGNGPNMTPDTGNSSVAINGANGTAQVWGNRIVNMAAPYASHGARMFGPNNGPYDQALNGPNTQLSWDTNRPPPSAGGSTPTPPNPILLALKANQDGSITAAWSGVSLPSYQVSAKTAQGSDPWKVIGSVTTQGCILVDGHPGWEYSILVEGVGSAIVRVAGDPNSQAPVNDLKFKSSVPPTQPATKPVVTITVDPPGSVEIKVVP